MIKRVVSLLVILFLAACAQNTDMFEELVSEQDKEKKTDALLYRDSVQAVAVEQGLTLPTAIKGNLAYHIDDSMWVNVVSYAELKIGAKSQEALLNEIRAISANRGDTLSNKDMVAASVQLASTMRAHLVDPTGGQRFQLVPLSAQEQAIDLSGQQSTLWQWAITPTQAGYGDLLISIDLVIDGQMRSFPVYQAKIKIVASAEESAAAVPFSVGLWELLVLLLVVVALVAAWWWFRYKRHQQWADVFISYRRADSAGFTISLYKELNAVFRHRIFKDIDSIPPGADFRREIENRLTDCRIVVVVIGRQWASIANEAGQKRLFDPQDFVRLEVATALAQNKVVVPVLVDGAAMPTATDLPEDLKALAFLNALNLPHDNWDAGVERLVKFVQQRLE